jgi:23S rRNA-/tRNA-specific pseudouridylate synthase
MRWGSTLRSRSSLRSLAGSLEESLERIFELYVSPHQRQQAAQNSEVARKHSLLALLPSGEQRALQSSHSLNDEGRKGNMRPLQPSDLRDIEGLSTAMQRLTRRLTGPPVEVHDESNQILRIFERYAKHLFPVNGGLPSAAGAHPLVCLAARQCCELGLVDLLVRRQWAPPVGLFTAMWVRTGNQETSGQSAVSPKPLRRVVRFGLEKHPAFAGSWLHALTLVSFAVARQQLEAASVRLEGSHEITEPLGLRKRNNQPPILPLHVSSTDLSWAAETLVGSFGVRGEVVETGSTAAISDVSARAETDLHLVHPLLPRIISLLEDSRKAEVAEPQLAKLSDARKGRWLSMAVCGRRLSPVFSSPSTDSENGRLVKGPEQISEPGKRGTELILAGRWADALAFFVGRREQQQKTAMRADLRVIADKLASFYSPSELTFARRAGETHVTAIWRNDSREDLAFAAAAAVASGREDVVARFRSLFGETLFTRDRMYRSQGDFLLQIVTTMCHTLLPLSVLRPLVDQLFRPVSSEGPMPTLAGSCNAQLLSSLKVRAAALSNALHSLWVEAVATVGTAPVALAALLGVTRTQSDGTSTFSVDKAAARQLLAAANGVSEPQVVIGPECASALVSCCALYFASLQQAAEANEHDDVCGELEAARSLLAKCSAVHFLVPLDQAAPHLHLKALYSPEFVTDEFGDAGVFFPVEQFGSNEVMLCGRAGRLVWELPMGGRKRSHRHHDPLERCGVRLLRLNLKVAVEVLVERCLTSAAPADEAPPVVFRDQDGGVAVLLKPSGMSSTLHATRSSVVSSLPRLHAWQGSVAGDVSVLAQHGLLNRIDAETSGLVAAARSEQALALAYSRANAHRLFSKKYVALVGRIAPSDRTRPDDHVPFLLPAGVICGPVFASGSSFTRNINHSLQKIASSSLDTDDGEGSTALDMRQAMTAYKILEYFPLQGVYVVEVSLQSGRRHQIRQHFAQISHPLLGDVRYHHRALHPAVTRLALHAAEMEMCVAVGRKVVVRCDLPEDLVAAIAQLRLTEEKRSLKST